MLNIIAPLNYEQWAVVVSPLLVPGAQHVETKPPPRQTEQLESVNASLSGTSSRAGEGMGEPVSRSMGVRRNSLKRDPEHPLNGPHPTDLNWFFQLPNGARNSMQGRPALDSQEVVKLYDHPESARGTILSVSG